MPDHDHLFKELLTVFFFEFLELFCPSVVAYLERNSIQFLDKEIFTDLIDGDVREVDIAARARFLNRDAFFILHVESQAQAQSDFNRRMFLYFAQLHKREALPVYPIALFSYDAPLREEPNRFDMVFPDLEVLHFQFRMIQLNRLNWRDYLDRSNPVASALMAKMSVKPQERTQVKVECLRTLGIQKLDAARPKLVSGFVDSYLELGVEEEREFEARLAAIGSAEEKEAAMEIVTSWMKRGIEQGIEQGISQGILQGIERGQEEIVLRLLRRRFGDLPADLEGRLDSLSSAQLVEFADSLLDFRDLDDARSWLRNHA